MSCRRRWIFPVRSCWPPSPRWRRGTRLPSRSRRRCRGPRQRLQNYPWSRGRAVCGGLPRSLWPENVIVGWTVNELVMGSWPQEWNSITALIYLVEETQYKLPRPWSFHRRVDRRRRAHRPWFCQRSSWSLEPSHWKDFAMLLSVKVSVNFIPLRCWGRIEKTGSMYSLMPQTRNLNLNLRGWESRSGRSVLSSTSVTIVSFFHRMEAFADKYRVRGNRIWIVVLSNREIFQWSLGVIKCKWTQHNS